MQVKRSRGADVGDRVSQRLTRTLRGTHTAILQIWMWPLPQCICLICILKCLCCRLRAGQVLQAQVKCPDGCQNVITSHRASKSRCMKEVKEHQMLSGVLGVDS